MAAELKCMYASLPRVARGKMAILKGDPKGEKFVYCNAKAVFIRDIEDPLQCTMFTQHAKETTVAAYAPSGFYVCSGDVSGKVKVWDPCQPDLKAKYEYQPIIGTVKDIAWSPDSKRIVVAGGERQSPSFIKPFLWDTGSNLGECSGHSLPINAVDYRPTRPFRLCAASEDRSVGFFAGPPFKCSSKNETCTGFGNCARFSPDGEYFVVGTGDGKLMLFNGKDGSLEAELVDPEVKGKAHAGGIYGVSWNPDPNDKSLLTASADKTCKLWNILDMTLVMTFKMGDKLEDQQLGCLWQGNHLLSVSLSGDINYLNRDDPSKPCRVIKGHCKSITAVATSIYRKKVYTASFDGRIASWTDDGQASYFKGSGHTSEIKFMQVVDDELVSCSIDDTLRFTPLDTEEYGQLILSVANLVPRAFDGLANGRCDVIDFKPSESQPQSFGVGEDGLIVLALHHKRHPHLAVVRNKKEVHIVDTRYNPCGVTVHPNQTEVAVVGEDSRVYIYTLTTDDSLHERTQIQLQRGQGKGVAYSPNGQYLGVITDNKTVHAFKRTEVGFQQVQQAQKSDIYQGGGLEFEVGFQQVQQAQKSDIYQGGGLEFEDVSRSWSCNSGLRALAWSPDSRYLAVCTIGSNIKIFSPAKTSSKIFIKGAHPPPTTIYAVTWYDETSLVSVGDDCCVRIWNVTPL